MTRIRMLFSVFAAALVVACGKDGGITNPPPPPPPPVATVTIKGFLSTNVTFAMKGDTSSAMQQVYLCVSAGASTEVDFLNSDGSVASVFETKTAVLDGVIKSLCTGNEEGYRLTTRVKPVRTGTATVSVVPKVSPSAKKDFTIRVENM